MGQQIIDSVCAQGGTRSVEDDKLRSCQEDTQSCQQLLLAQRQEAVPVELQPLNPPIPSCRPSALIPAVAPAGAADRAVAIKVAVAAIIVRSDPSAAPPPAALGLAGERSPEEGVGAQGRAPWARQRC